MGKYTNPHTRLSEMITLMSSSKYREDEEPGLTIRKISELTEIPEAVIKKDLRGILSGENCLKEFIEAEIGNEEFKMLLADRKREEDAVNVRFMFDYDCFSEYIHEGKMPVFLTPFEKNLFAKVLHKSDFSDDIWIKDPVFFVPEEVTDYQGVIRDAIENNNPVSFRYNSKEGEEYIKCLNARKLYETLDNKKIYCIAFNDEMKPRFYRLDRMSDLKAEYDMEMPPLPDDAMNFLDHIWGADASGGEGEVFHVKVKIFKDTKNIRSKIENDTRDRKYGKLYDDEEDENIAYYEDDISGSNSFKKWLRRYGASVLVLEPLWLAEEMYQSAVRRLETYQRFDTADS